MKIAIIADVHDNWANLDKVLKYIHNKKIKTIICLGDLANSDTLDRLKNHFLGKIYYIFGNTEIDLYPNKKINNNKNFSFLGTTSGIIKLKDKKIAITHWPKEAHLLAKSGNYDLVFYGHSHKPEIQIIKNAKLKMQNKDIILANPGNLCGIFYKPSFAIYDIDQNKLELKILENIKI